ncbi:hypothetical protein C5S29_03740 [ANME-1 cluster archaeon GoMg3.2]|nr:hypothetical protein [ANME-1 cluster archaeon GoMg3.2]
MALKIITEIFGILLGLLGSYLLAGEYLLGERIKKLEEWLNKLSNSSSYFSVIKKILVNPPKGIYPTQSWQQYHRSLISVIITLIPVLLWIFFIGKALTKLVPMYLNIPITLFSGFIIWFLIFWISLSIEVVIFMIRYSPNTSGKRISWWILIPASILAVIGQLFKGLTFYVAVGIFLRYAIDISIFPLKKIKLFGQRYNLGYLTALLGAILLAVGVILTYISQHL